jgi:hypothetical protein
MNTNGDKSNVALRVSRFSWHEDVFNKQDKVYIKLFVLVNNQLDMKGRKRACLRETFVRKYTRLKVN